MATPSDATSTAESTENFFQTQGTGHELVPCGRQAELEIPSMSKKVPTGEGVSTSKDRPTIIDFGKLISSDKICVQKFFFSLPRGLKFDPTRNDMIFYLEQKLSNITLPIEVVPEIEIDTYSLIPSEIQAEYKRPAEEWYLFAKGVTNVTKKPKKEGFFWKAAESRLVCLNRVKAEIKAYHWQSKNEKAVREWKLESKLLSRRQLA